MDVQKYFQKLQTELERLEIVTLEKHETMPDLVSIAAELQLDQSQPSDPYKRKIVREHKAWLRGLEHDRREQIATLARLRAALAALTLAEQLIEKIDQKQAAPIRAITLELSDQVQAWRKDGRGWFEDRMIKKVVPNFVPLKDEKTGEIVYQRNVNGKIKYSRRTGQPLPVYTIDEENPTVAVYFGPYRYFRWREAGKVKTHYLGRVDKLEEDSQPADSNESEE